MKRILEVPGEVTSRWLAKALANASPKRRQVFGKNLSASTGGTHNSACSIYGYVTPLEQFVATKLADGHDNVVRVFSLLVRAGASAFDVTRDEEVYGIFFATHRASGSDLLLKQQLAQIALLDAREGLHFPIERMCSFKRIYSGSVFFGRNQGWSRQKGKCS
jgi:hypothetical protein